MPTGPLKVLIVHAHPFPRRSRVNRVFREAAEGIEGIRIHELYEQYPDFLIDVQREQKALEEADVLVLQHPFFWYSCPSLLKEWIDSVFERGWAYAGGNALAGKHWLQVISTGGPEVAYQREGYNHFTIEELLRPFEQTALLCGMTPLKPVLTQGARAISEQEIAERADGYRKMLERIVQGDLPSPISTVNAPEAR